MIIIRTDAQSNRKALAGALSELFHEKPRYCGAPTFAYEFGVGRLARDASLRLVPSLNETAAERLAAALAERGFSCAVETVCSEIETEDNAPCEAAAEESPVPDSRFTVTIPADRLSPDALARLRKLITSRHRLFCDALNATELPVEERDGKIAFPWFEQTDDEEEQAAYALFIERLAELSNRLKWAVRVVPWPRVESMRTSPPARRAFCIISGMPSPTLRVVRVVAKGLVTLSFSSSLMPEPSSRIVMVMSLLSSTDTIISTSAAFARTLFCARSRICSDRSRMGSLTPCIWPGCREYRREPGGRILPH